MTIDLGKKPEKASLKPIGKPSNGPFYPTVYLDGLGDIDIEDGAEVVIHGTVERVVKTTADGKTTYSCTVKAKKMECDDCEDEGLDGAMKKIEKKKSAAYDEENDE